jgi:hypothetical protein
MVNGGLAADVVWAVDGGELPHAERRAKIAACIKRRVI